VLGDDADDIVLVERGDRKLALIGCTDVSSPELEEVLESVRTLSDLDQFSYEMVGAAHLVATFGGTVRAQGTVFNIRRLFQLTVAGVVVLGDCAHEVAALTGARVNTQALATRLLVPGIPWPLDGETVWDGVTPVQGGTWQCLHADGTAQSHVWWSAPEPLMPIEEASDVLESRLQRSVQLRARRPLSTSTDLSGGMDSTSLAFLAAKENEQVLTFRYDARDPENDDDIWADRAAAHLHAARHVVMDRRQAPRNFDDTTSPGQISKRHTHGFVCARCMARSPARYASSARCHT
jgi:asparagine synthase (glutamine-hydrolysing)